MPSKYSDLCYLHMQTGPIFPHAMILHDDILLNHFWRPLTTSFARLACSCFGIVTFTKEFFSGLKMKIFFEKARFFSGGGISRGAIFLTDRLLFFNQIYCDVEVV